MKLRIRIETAHGIQIRDAIGDPGEMDRSIRDEFADEPCGVTVMVLQ